MRSSFQRGSIVVRKKKDGKKVFTIRWCERNPQTRSGWKHRRETLPATVKTEKQANKVLASRVAQANTQNNDSRSAAAVPTLQEFISDVWQEHMENKNIKPSTLYSYKSMLKNHILPVFGNRRLDQIMPADITKFINQAHKAHSVKYVLNLYALLNNMMEVAHQHDLIETSPVRRKLHRPEYNRPEKPVLMPEQIRLILLSVPVEYKLLFVVIAVLGLRLGEALALRWQDVEFATQKLSIAHSIWRGRLLSPKTRASARPLHLPAALVSLLRDQQAKAVFSEPEDFIFCRADGTPLDPDHLRREVLYPVLDELRIPRSSRAHGFHLFRHTAGTIVHATTGDLKLAQEFLRHAQIATTSDIYIHVPEKVAAEATEAVAREINLALTLPTESEAVN